MTSFYVKLPDEKYLLLLLIHAYYSLDGTNDPLHLVLSLRQLHQILTYVGDTIDELGK